MEAPDTDFSPKESFDLINQVIQESKFRYEENGSLIMTWGLAVMLAGIGQYLLIQNGHGNLSWSIWTITMIPMFIYSLLRGYKDGQKQARSLSGIENVSRLAWFLAGSMAMLTGFVFTAKFGKGFTTVMFLPFCVAALVSALSIKKNSFVWLTLVATGLAYLALYIPWSYHPLLVACIACVLFFIPGLLLRSDFKKRANV